MIWLLAVLAVLIVGVILLYNKLVSLRVRSSNAWADIDVQLKRRHDLVPNLIAVVEGYASHEKSILEDVARLRADALNASNVGEVDSAESQLTRGIKSLFAIAENYPNLKADQGFRKMQDQLADVENNIQYARRYFNAVVRDMNTMVETVPTNLVANLFGFHRLVYFQASEDERQSVTIDLTDDKK